MKGSDLETFEGYVHTNPNSDIEVGDTVRYLTGTVEWTVTGKGAFSGLALVGPTGRRRGANRADVVLVRLANPEVTAP